MAVTISNIIAQTKASFARPSLFRVEIAVATPSQVGDIGLKKLSLNCYNALIPGLSIATTDKDVGFRSVAYQKLYDDVLLSFYCSEDLSELKYMQDWMEKISNPINNRLGYYDSYVSTIHIIHLSKAYKTKTLDKTYVNNNRNEPKKWDAAEDSNKKTLTTTLIEAYPKKIDPIQLDYASNDIMRLTVSFTYRYYKQIWGDKEISSSGTFARRSDSKDNSILTELDPTFHGGGTSDESDIESNGGGDNF